jgi:glycosyltransferase involved in cell wall biosynthesis
MTPARSSDEMRVLVNGVSARVGGGGTYLISQLRALGEVPGLDLTIHAVGQVAAELEEACPSAHVVREPQRTLARRLAWEQATLARRAANHDLVYSPGNFALLASPRPQVLLLQKASLFGDAGRSVRRLFPARTRARLALEGAAARASIRRATRVVAISPSLATAIESDLGPLSKLSVLPGPAPALPPGRPPPGVPAGPYVLVVAHDLPHKDWDGLVDLFLRSTDLPPLVVVGRARPERMRQLRATVAATGPGRVTFLGPFADRSALAGLYVGAACCLAHSYIEALGLTGLEALSLGVPVAASDIPAHRDGLGAAAIYYPPDNLRALAAAVRKALSSRVGQANPAVLAVETWSANADALAVVIREAVPPRRGSAGGRATP